MTTKRDYSCEVIALTVLTVLSALSHFWLIMIVIGAVVCVVGAGFLISHICLRIRMELLARLFSTECRMNAMPETEASIGGVGPSLPLA